MAQINEKRVPRQLLILNGPAGAGKTTVARRLVAWHPNTVCISGDAVRAFAPADPAATRGLLGGGSTYRAAASLVTSYYEMGARRVIFEFVFETPSHVAHFNSACPPDVVTQLVTLWAPVAVLQARAAARAGREPFGDRIAASARAMESCIDRLGTVITTDGRTVDDIAREVDRALSFAVTAHAAARRFAL